MEATPTFAGIDWSWQHHALCVIDDQGRRIEELTVPHSRPGLARITTMLRRHAVTKVSIERGDGPVVEHLIRDGCEDEGVEPVAFVARGAVAGSQRLDLPGRDHHDLEPLTEQVLDHRSVTALDPDPGDSLAAQQLADLGQPGSRMRHGDLFDPAPLGIDDAQGVVLPGPVDPGESGRSLHFGCSFRQPTDQALRSGT